MLVISMAMVLSCRYNVGHIHGDGHFVVTMLVRFMTMVLSRRYNVGQIHDDGPFSSLQCWSDSWQWSILVVRMLVGFMTMQCCLIHDDGPFSSLQCWSDSWR